MLELPATLRLPRADEMPDNPEANERLKSILENPLEEGFVLHANADDSKQFDFYAAININNSRLWELFLALSAQLPEEVGCVYGPYDDDLIYSEYVSLTDAIIAIGQYKNEIIGDCNIHLGLVNNSDDALIEIFISETKYINVWGMDETGFRDIMKEFGLQENSVLRFMDQYPTIVVPLTRVDKNARSTKTVVAGIFTALKAAAPAKEVPDQEEEEP